MAWGIQVSRRSPTLNTGRLRNKISLVKVSSQQDSMGGQNISINVLYANVWASVEALNGSDKFAAHEFVSEVSHQIVIRYIGAAPSWLADTNYLGNAVVKDSNGNLQEAQSSGGLSGDSAPTWNATQGDTTLDGDPSTGITWLNIGPAPNSTGVVAGMQVWFKGSQLQIQAVQNPDGRNNMLLLQCVEINDSLQQILC
jgi:head-tail adaptor